MELNKKHFQEINDSLTRINEIDDKLNTINGLATTIVNNDCLLEFNLDVLDMTSLNKKPEPTVKTVVNNKLGGSIQNEGDYMPPMAFYYSSTPLYDEIFKAKPQQKDNKPPLKTDYVTQGVSDKIALKMLSMVTKELNKEKEAILKNLNKKYNIETSQ